MIGNGRTQFDFHIGAHKTATTFLQHLLDSNEDALSRANVRYLHHRKSRKMLIVPCQIKGHLRAGVSWSPEYSDEELSSIVDSLFHSLLYNNPKQVLLSDENFPGHCGHLARNGILYNRKSRFFDVYRDFFPVAPDRFFLSIRNYADFFSSAYMQFLLDVKPHNFVLPDVTVESVMSRRPNWASFVKTLLEYFPNSKVVVWRYEDFPACLPTVLRKMFGNEVADNFDLTTDKRKIRQSLNNDVFLQFKEDLASAGIEHALNKLQNPQHDPTDLLAPVQKSTSRSIFSTDQTVELNRRYAKHCQFLKTQGSNVETLF